MAFDVASNITGLTDWFGYANYVTEGNFGWVILMTWFVISLVIMSRGYDNKSAFIIASFTTTIFGIFFKVMGLVNDFTMYICIIGTIVAIGIGMKDN